jgi:hypothetical protein
MAELVNESPPLLGVDVVVMGGVIMCNKCGWKLSVAGI